MHPILARLERLGGYLALWCAGGVFESAVLTQQGLSWPEALVQVLPPLIVYSFICLSAWYVCRATPLATSGVPRVLTASLVAAFIGAALWLALSEAWLATLESMPAIAPITPRFRAQVPFLFAVNLILYLLVLSVHYVVLAFEAFRTAERQQLELQVLTRDAELRALRAQVNPHFLFNTLNSIAALIHENPAAAEDVVTRLADVFRHALTASGREHTRLADELEFLRSWLAIEHVRFGDRLRVVEDVEPGLDDVPVPGLLFQPLIENAVRYAVAPRAEGGTITLRVRRDPSGDTFTAEIADDGPGFSPGGRPRGNGVGLESVRERLRLGGAKHGFALESAPGRGTRARITLPLAPGPLPRLERAITPVECGPPLPSEGQA